MARAVAAARLAEKSGPDHDQDRNQQKRAEDDKAVPHTRADLIPTERNIREFKFGNYGAHDLHPYFSLPTGPAGSSSVSVPAEMFRRCMR